MDTTNLSKILKDAMKSGKYAIGAKECIAGMKGAKALLLTHSVPPVPGGKLRAEATKHKIPVVELPISSAELARMLGRPYRVSTVALRGVSEADLKQLLK
jgi:ribosomal protein L30E